MCESIWVKLMVIELSSEFFMEWTEYSKGGGLHIGISFVAARWAIQRKWVYSSPICVVTSQQANCKNCNEISFERCLLEKIG